MTPIEFKTKAMRIYGKRGWVEKLARVIGVNRTTIFRMMGREQVAGPYEVALLGLVEQHRREREIEKAARKLLPRKRRVKKGKKK